MEIPRRTIPMEATHQAGASAKARTKTAKSHVHRVTNVLVAAHGSDRQGGTMTHRLRFLIIAALILLPVLHTRAASTLQYGEPADASLNAGEQIQYAFSGKAGDKPVIAMNAHGGDMQPYVALYD